MRLGVLAIAMLIGAATPAAAGMVARAEKGSVPLVAGAPQGLAAPVTLQPGQTAWTETLRPQSNVRLLDAVPPRIRPGTKGVDAGTVLYGYRLKGGFAYCPASDYRAPVREVQCFRDFDGDGRFDGAYVSDMRDMKSRVIAAFLHELAPTNKQRYEAIGADQAIAVPATIVFEGVKKGQAVFSLRVEDSRLDGDFTCEPNTDSCDMLGLTFKIRTEGQAVRLELLNAAPTRGLNVILTGGPV